LRTVRFLEGDTLWPYTRQTPGNDGIFGESRFLFGPGPEGSDWLVVMNELPTGYNPSFPTERTIFISGEPPTMRSFHPAFLAQFGTAISVDPTLPHPNLRWESPLVPWHAGIRAREPLRYTQALTFSALVETPSKTRLCSCICSTLTKTEGHRQRLAFVRALQQALGDRIDFFGRGFKEIADKNEALDAYRFHIAIENCRLPHYWTEKLADAFLRNCFPIYVGAPNIDAYFSPQSLATIDITDAPSAISKVAAILESDPDPRAVSYAKHRVMFEHNILARLDRLIGEIQARSEPNSEPRALLPESAFLPRGPWHRDVANALSMSVREAGRTLRRRLGLR